MTQREKGSFRCFSNRDCEYYPCHEWKGPGAFNCLFCYCPLYPLGTDCGGDFVMISNGIKDCSNCLFPHREENYEVIMERMEEVLRRFPIRRKGPAEEGKE